MVDAVITWVDGADPVHKEKRELYARKERVDHPDAYAVTRFSNNGELRYCISLIRKNAPWIKRIFLITDSQCPNWLDEEKKSYLGITIVDHTVLFRGHEDVLPTFNSITIETIMHKIPDLDNRFIYFNDDFLIIKPVLESDYFEGSTPLIRGFAFSSNKLLRELHRAFNPKKFKMTGMVGTRFRQEDGIQLSRKVKICHTPHPIIKKDYAALMSENDRLRRNISFKFRDLSQFGPIPIYVSAGLQERKVKVIARDDVYIDPVEQATIIHSDIMARISDAKIRHMCIQSLDRFDAQSQAEIYKILDEIVKRERW